jgi:hypothetical protein
MHVARLWVAIILLFNFTGDHTAEKIALEKLSGNSFNFNHTRILILQWVGIRFARLSEMRLHGHGRVAYTS